MAENRGKIHESMLWITDGASTERKSRVYFVFGELKHFEAAQTIARLWNVRWDGMVVIHNWMSPGDRSERRGILAGHRATAGHPDCQRRSPPGGGGEGGRSPLHP